MNWYLYTFSKNDVISPVRKHYCALDLGLGLELGLGVGLAKIRFRLNVLSSKCSIDPNEFIGNPCWSIFQSLFYNCFLFKIYFLKTFVIFTGYIFTAGCKDRLVKAFQQRKTKLENMGKIEIPKPLGSATCLACNDKTLFVGTEKNAILSAELFSRTTENDFAPAYTSSTPHLYGRFVSSGAFLTKHSLRNTKRQMEQSQEHSPDIFSLWDDDEIARGFEKGTVCICPLKQLKLKQHSGPGSQYWKQISISCYEC